MNDAEKSKPQLLQELSSARERITQLEQAERDSATIFRMALDLICIADINTATFIKINPAFQATLGFSESELLGRPFLEFLHPDDLQPTIRVIKEQLKAGKSVLHFENRYHTVDGGYRWLDWISHPIAEKGLTFAVARDVTDHKQAEEALRQSETRWQFALDGAGDGVWDWNALNNRVYFSPRWKTMLGYAEDEVGDTLSEWETRVHPDDLPAAHAALDRLFRKETPVYQNEHRLKCRDGSYKWILDRGKVMEWTDDGKPRRVIGTHTDITARKLAEEQLHERERLLEEAQQVAQLGYYVLDVSTGKMKGSRQIEAIFGIDENYRKDVQSWAEVIHPDQREEVVRYLQQQVLDGGQPFDREYRILRVNDQTERWVHGLGEFKRDASGKPIALFGTIQDITNRKRTEEALRKSEERFRLLVQNSSDLIAVLDENGRMLAIYGPLEKMLGYRTDELIGNICFDLIHADDRERALNVFTETLLQPGATRRLVYRFQRKDGFWTSFEAIGTNLLHDPAVRGMVLNVRDVAEHQQVEEKMNTAIRRLENVIEFLPDATFIVDQDKRIIAWNRAIEEMTGIPKKDMLGKEHLFASVPFYGEPRPYLLDLLGTDSCEIASKYAYVHQRRDVLYAEVFTPALYQGRGAWVWAFASPLYDQEGRIVGAIESIRDITEKKQAENEALESQRRLADIIEFFPDATIVVDGEGKVIAWNRAIEKMTGVRAEEMIGKGDFEYAIPFYGERRPILVDLALHPDPMMDPKYTNIRHEEDLLLGEAYTPNLKGGQAFLTATACALYNSTGRIVGAIESIRDITERKRAEEERAKLAGQLQQAMKMEAVGRLAGGVAHDFNNLLTGIIGNIQLALLDLQPNDPLVELLTEVSQAAESAATLTRQLLSFSRKQLIEPKILDLNELIAALHRMLVRLIGEDIELKTVPGPGLRAVRIDPGQFEQILVNLVVNSRDAMPDGGKLTIETGNVELDEVFCRGHSLSQPGRYVLLSVADTGFGMSEEVKRHLFEPFFTTKEQGKGTGLGLATIYGAVKQAGGLVEVNSEIGQGTTFKIYLPCVEEKAGRLEKGGGALEMPGGNETVLLVEDERVVRELAIRVLKRLGYKVLHADSGGNALVLAEQYPAPIHLLFTDVVMPGMNGRQLAERIIKTHPETKILYSSGYTENAVSHHSVIDEGLHFIGKPYTTNSLAKAVRKVLDALSM